MQVIEVVAALVVDGDRFLICRRPAHKARGGLFEFPGGKVEPGETQEAAIIRECREELNITVRPEKPIADVTHHYPDLTIHLTLLHVHLTGDMPVALEHDQLCWITVQELDDYPFCPADVAFHAAIRQCFA